MLKCVHTITPQCILNRGESGCAQEIADRLEKYMEQSTEQGEQKTIRVTFETVEM